jgi:nicotinamidase-related amidase
MNSSPKTCLLVVDVQQALIDEGPHDQAAFLHRLQTLLAAARKAGAPVAYVQHADEGLVEGSAGWKIHPAVAPLAGEPTFGKHFSSSFKDTGLEAWLRSQGIEALVVVGMQTEYCLDATIKSAFEKGFRVTVPVGAHTTFDGRGMTAPQINAWYADQIWDGRFASLVPVEQAVTLLR